MKPPHFVLILALLPLLMAPECYYTRTAPPPPAVAAACGWPSYQPAFWNQAGRVTVNNCYNYAVNRRTDTSAQPGKGGGRAFNTEVLSCNDITASALVDGIPRASAAGSCPPGESFVALVIANNPTFVDYHWYRQDMDSTWSHKPGMTPATRVDSLGNVITSPATAARGPYGTFCGYYCVCSSNIEGAANEKIL